MVDEQKISVSQDELDDLLASLDSDDSGDTAFAVGLRMRKKAIVDILDSLSGDPVCEHVSQGELDDLMETSDTVRMSKAEIVDHFGFEALYATISPDSSKIMSPDFFKGLNLETPSPRRSFVGGARTLVRKILPTRSRHK